MDIKLTVPDDKIALVVTAYCDTCGYQATIANDDTGEIIPNPETKAQFTKRMIITEIKNRVKLYERKTAELAVVSTVVDIT